MNEDPLDSQLAAYARTAVPTVSTSTRSVWSEIERRKTKSFLARILPGLEWHELLAEPRLAFAAVALAAAIGLIPAITLRDGSPTRAAMAREALHLDTFSAHAELFHLAREEAPKQ